MNAPQHPKGIRFSADEQAFVLNVLLAVAEQAKQANNPGMFNMALLLRERVQHSEIAGEGFPPDQQDKFRAALERAGAAQDPEIYHRALVNFFATAIRLHPDPARLLAHHIVDYLSATTQEAAMQGLSSGAQQGASIVLGHCDAKIEKLLAMYNSEGWPEPEDLLLFLRDWLAAGKKAVDRGEDPWKSDPDLESDEESAPE